RAGGAAMPFMVREYVARRDLGPVFPGRCGSCRNVVVFRYVRETSWFRVFAVPVFPIARVHLQACPLCSNEAPMTDEDAELAHSLVKQGREWTFDEDDGGEEERAPLLGSDDVAALQA